MVRFSPFPLTSNSKTLLLTNLKEKGETKAWLPQSKLRFI